MALSVRSVTRLTTLAACGVSRRRHLVRRTADMSHSSAAFLTAAAGALLPLLLARWNAVHTLPAAPAQRACGGADALGAPNASRCAGRASRRSVFKDMAVLFARFLRPIAAMPLLLHGSHGATGTNSGLL